MPEIRTQGITFQHSGSSIVNPPGMQILSINDKDATTELEKVLGPDGVISRGVYGEAVTVDIEALLEPETAVPKKLDVIPFKLNVADAAAKKFVVDEAARTRKHGDRVVVNFSATWDASLEPLIV